MHIYQGKACHYRQWFPTGFQTVEWKKLSEELSQSQLELQKDLESAGTVVAALRELTCQLSDITDAI